ncbi:nucleotide sugar dehydrogenase [Candidatus Pacebacteria bacterium]|nr:nucleotide sugar dehydrogenase [Candidatus Paceibacterota bacterium]
MDRKDILAVVGLGYVGLPLALLAECRGYFVYGIDIDEEKIEKLNSKEAPFIDEKIQEELKNSEIIFSTDITNIANASIVAICVPTPVHTDHMPNLSIIESAVLDIGQNLKKGQLIILESTVNPDVTESIVLPILEEASGLKGGIDFYLAHAPERINPGDKKWNVENISRVVGSLEPVGLDKAALFYESILTAPVRKMQSLKEAEAVKVVENTFRDINIAFVNELARSFTRLGIDIMNVIDGAATKPFGYMPFHPGCGVGGHCIPVDPYYLIEHARKNGFDHDFLSLARRINNQMPHFAVERIADALNEKRKTLKGSVITVLGVSYKPDIDDPRESPSFEIIRLLEARGAEVRVFDPFVREISTVDSYDRAVDNADAVLIATAHSLFRESEPAFFVSHNVDAVVDGRNCLSKQAFLDAGILYKGIGR